MDEIAAKAPLLPARRARLLVTAVPRRARARLPAPPGLPALGWLLVAAVAGALLVGTTGALLALGGL